MINGEKLQGTILFADIVGCSEISNNCSIEDYATILNEYHNCAHETYKKLLDNYSDKVIEFRTRGDEVCLILHSKSLEDTEAKAVLNDIRNALIFALSLKLRWRASAYNLKRVENGLLPRDAAIGIHQGLVYFYDSPTKEKKSSESFAINLAKRIEDESRNGKYSQIMVSSNAKYWMEKNGIPVEFDEHTLSELKGITTIPGLHEIKYVGDELKNFISEQIEDVDFKEEDLEKYKELAEVYPSDFWTNLLVECVTRAKREKKRRAERIKPEIKEIKKGTPSYYYNEAEKNYSIGKYEEALSNLNKAIELDPKDAAAYYNRGLTYAKLKRYKDALADCTKAIELDPKYTMAYNNRGNAYSDLEKYKEALADYTRAIELDPNYAAAYYNKAGLYALKKEKDKLIENLKMAIQLDPKFKEEAKEDDDFKAYRNKKWFKELTK